MNVSPFRKALAAFTLVQGSLLSAVSAHPGAPGHTHGDEWPFDLMAAVGVGILGVAAVCVAKAAKRRNRGN